MNYLVQQFRTFCLHSERHCSLQIGVGFSSLGKSSLGLSKEQNSLGATGPSCVTFQSHDLVEEMLVAEADDHGNVAVKTWTSKDVGRHQEDVPVAEKRQNITHGPGRSFLRKHGVGVDVQLLGNDLGGPNVSGDDQNSAESSLRAVGNQKPALEFLFYKKGLNLTKHIAKGQAAKVIIQ